MRRTIIIIILACMAVFTTQCKKAEVQNPTDGISDELIDVTLSVGTGTKTVIDGIGQITWKANDEIRVFGETAGCLGTLTTTAGGDPATFTGKIHGITTSQTLRFYYYGSNAVTQNGDNYTFSIASNQDGTLATIADKFHLAYGESEYPVQPGTTNLGTISMTSKIAIADFHFTRADGYPFGKNIRLSGVYTSITFNAKTGVFDVADETGTITMSRDNIGEHYYVALLPGEQTFNFSNYVVGKTLGAKVIEENSMYGVWNSETSHYDKPIEVELVNINNVPTGALAGTFKIEADKSVFFANGNLYKSGETWGFEARQDDYRTFYYSTYSYKYPRRFDGTTYATNDANATPDGDFGYFSWSGDTNKNYGAVVSTNYNDFAGDFLDWGKITSLPGNTAENQVWYTLSYNQWKYLIKERPDNANRCKYWNSLAPFGEGKGMVLLPEEVPSDECTQVMNDITSFDKVKTYGALFLPMFGLRENGTTYINSQYGYYQSSDANGSTQYRCILIGYGGAFFENLCHNRTTGCAVRLVQNIPSEANGSASSFDSGNW